VGEGEADEDWARCYLEHSLHEVYFWLERLGVEWLTLLPQKAIACRAGTARGITARKLPRC